MMMKWLCVLFAVLAVLSVEAQEKTRQVAATKKKWMLTKAQAAEDGVIALDGNQFTVSHLFFEPKSPMNSLFMCSLFLVRSFVLFIAIRIELSKRIQCCCVLHCFRGKIWLSAM
jgi:hypothetical protein